MTSSNPESYPTPCMTSLPLEAAQPKSAKIEEVFPAQIGTAKHSTLREGYITHLIDLWHLS